MTDVIAGPTSKLSRQLRDTLIAYCLYMESASLDDLAEASRQGGLLWFPDAFSEAITAGIFTPGMWDWITQTGLDEDASDQVDADLREVWAHTAPDRPFPLDQ